MAALAEQSASLVPLFIGEQNTDSISDETAYLMSCALYSAKYLRSAGKGEVIAVIEGAENGHVMHSVETELSKLMMKRN